MLKRLRDAIKNQDYLYLGLEFVVVIGSILIAFELDRWGEDRREYIEEQNYLLRLKEDLQIEVSHLDDAMRYAKARIEAALLLEQVVANPATAVQAPKTLANAVETASWRSFPNLSAFVYTELQSSGKLALIRSDELRRALTEHYSTFRFFSRVGLDRDVQLQFDRQTAGILSSEELVSIENGTWQNQNHELSSERASEIAEQLAARPQAMALIPSMVQHHVFNKRVIEQTRKSALDIIEQIEAGISASNDH